MNELSLFTGGGGGLLGGKLLGWRTVCYVEWEPYCIAIIKARIADGFLDDAPIWDDVRTFDGRPWAGSVDIITAGFPCQPFSVAGHRRGEDDDRNMWPATVRIIREVQPTWALLENVPGLRSKAHRYFGTVLRDLAAIGYDARWDCIPACALGARHVRDRLWILAHPGGHGRDVAGVGCELVKTPQGMGGSRRHAASSASDCRGVVSECAMGGGGPALADSDRKRRSAKSERHGQTRLARRGGVPVPAAWWRTKPTVGRVADGVADRVDRLKALGNGQVPAVAATAWLLLSGAATYEDLGLIRPE